jgi:hypothetical protein
MVIPYILDEDKRMADAVCLSQIEFFGIDPEYGFEVNTSNSADKPINQ